tara:strand:+ start:16146 stop:16649 length:504 start_codon:yes stop_codon:yes gene_type:complete
MLDRIGAVSILLGGAAMTSAGCDASHTSRSENTAFGSSAPGSVSDCAEKFAAGGEVWGDNPIGASFVYDVTEIRDLEADGQFWQREPGDEGTHSVTIHNGDGGAQAVEDFLKSPPTGDSETFSSERISLVRVNEAPEAKFEEALRRGCERLRDGVTIRQVTFVSSTR